MMFFPPAKSVSRLLAVVSFNQLLPALGGASPLEAELPVVPTAVDTDADGIADVTDNCPINSNAEQADANGDGDNCPSASRPSQSDSDDDVVGDVETGAASMDLLELGGGFDASRRFMWIETTQPFDALRIEMQSLLSLAEQLDVYSACVGPGT